MRKWLWLAALSMLFVAGCTQLEHREDSPDKKTLTGIENPLIINKLWSVSAGSGTDKKDIKLQLARAGTSLYTVDSSGMVYAINECNGKTIWTINLRAPVTAGPAVAEGKLVVGTGDGRVIAVDIDHAKLAWSSTSTSEILATPQISDNVVYVHTMDGGLSALSLLDGRQLWRFNHTLPSLMLRRSSTPVVVGDTIVAGFANGKLLAMQKMDGTAIWSQEIAHPKGTTDLQRMVDISADPVVKDGSVYAVSYQGNMVALSLTTGNKIWEREVPSYSGFVVSDNLIFVAGTNGDVVALDVDSGQTYWLQTELQGRRLSKPAILGKYLVIGDDDGLVHFIEKSTGKLVGRFPTDKNGIEATPLVHNNVVYILGCSGRLAALTVN